MPETAPVHLSNSARLVASALAESEQSTVTALANAARVSKSTVAKTLALLERSGAAIRTVREDDGIREADLWSPSRALGALLVPAAAGAPDYGHCACRIPRPCRSAAYTGLCGGGRPGIECGAVFSAKARA